MTHYVFTRSNGPKVGLVAASAAWPGYNGIGAELIKLSTLEDVSSRMARGQN